MSATHPKGWVEDEPAALAVISEQFGGEIPNDEGEVARPIWADLYQVGQSCTWNGLAQACYGLTGEKTSPYAGYWFARAEEHPYIAADPDGKMPDEGISMTQILDSARLSGTCRWDLWNPSTPGFSIHATPPALARVDSQARNFDVSAIVGLGDALPNAAAVAIDSGHVPLLAMDVDQAFEDYRTGILREQVGPSLGGHLGAVWRHWRIAGERVFLFLTNWQAPAVVILSEARVRQARQVFVVRGVS